MFGGAKIQVGPKLGLKQRAYVEALEAPPAGSGAEPWPVKDFLAFWGNLEASGEIYALLSEYQMLPEGFPLGFPEVRISFSGIC